MTDTDDKIDEIKILIDNWGQLGHLTPPQASALELFKAAVSEEHIAIAKYTVENIDQVSLRFLRARRFDVPKALELIAECHKLKTEGKAKLCASMSPHDALRCDVAVLKKFYPHTQRGFDKFNRPLLFERDGRVDANALHIIFGKEEFLRYHYWTMDYRLDQMFIESAQKFYQASPKEQRPDGTFTWNVPNPVPISTCAVSDMAGFGLAHCSSKMMELVKLLASVDNVVYPEMLGKMIVINAPWLAVQTWNIAKVWLDPRTQAKIEIIGPGAESIKRLHELIPIEYLPPEYAGIGQELYYFKPHTDFLQLAKGTEISKTIDIPIGKVLFVDTYLGEGILDVSVSIIPYSSISSPSNMPPSSPSSSSMFFSRKAMPSKRSSIPIIDSWNMKYVPDAGESRGRERILKHYLCSLEDQSNTQSSDNDGKADNSMDIKPDSMSTDNTKNISTKDTIQHKTYVVTWKCPGKESYFGGAKTSFIYSFTISDTISLPDSMKYIERHTTAVKSPTNGNHTMSSNDSGNNSLNRSYRSSTILGSNATHSDKDGSTRSQVSETGRDRSDSMPMVASYPPNQYHHTPIHTHSNINDLNATEVHEDNNHMTNRDSFSSGAVQRRYSGIKKDYHDHVSLVSDIVEEEDTGKL